MMNQRKQRQDAGSSLRSISQLLRVRRSLAATFGGWSHRASVELFRRPVDERFSSLVALWNHCHTRKRQSQVYYELAAKLRPEVKQALLTLADGRSLGLNKWSFSQLCGLASVSKADLRQLSARHSNRLLQERLCGLGGSLEILATRDIVRSVSSEGHDRLWDVDLLTMVREFATDFQPPPPGFNGATGLYAGEQDVFCFLIDPLGWTEINGQAFAPGFFVWNSEVGARPGGVSTFWFQRVCQNHIIWGATGMEEFICEKAVDADDAIRQIRRRIEVLVDKRDQSKDHFAKLIAQAMKTRLGSDPQEVESILERMSIDRELAKRVIQAAERTGGFTIFSVLDALTRANRELPNAAQRTEADRKAARLLSLIGEHRPLRRAANAITLPAPAFCPC